MNTLIGRTCYVNWDAASKGVICEVLQHSITETLNGITQSRAVTTLLVLLPGGYLRTWPIESVVVE